MASTHAPTGIRAPGSIWAKCIDQHAADQGREESRRGDAFVYFVGSRSSGKSTLLNSFLFPTKAEVPRPSEGLEYTFVRKPSTFDHERKDLGHIWEVGGAPEFAEAITKGQHIFLTPAQVATAVVVIVLDLSDPGAVMPSALTWLGLLQRKLGGSYQQHSGGQAADGLRHRARGRIWAQHEDRELVSHTGISVVLAATKFDAFMNSDAEQLRLMARALRCVAHAHGAHLVMLGGLQPGAGAAGGKGAAMQHSNQEEFGRLLNHLMFVGPDKKLPAKAPPQLDHLGPVFVPAGTDKLRDIGRPRGPFAPSSSSSSSSGFAEVAALVEEWRRAVGEVFPAKPREARAGAFEIDARYNEEAIDALRARKEEQLQAYRRQQQEAAARASEAAAGSGAPTAAAGAQQQGRPAGQLQPAQQQQGRAGATVPGKQSVHREHLQQQPVAGVQRPRR